MDARAARSHSLTPLVVCCQTNPLNKQLHLTSPTPYLEHGDAFELESYVGHSFMVKELPSKLGNCINGDDPDDPKKCGRAYFKVSDGANKNTFQGMLL